MLPTAVWTALVALNPSALAGVVARSLRWLGARGCIAKLYEYGNPFLHASACIRPPSYRPSASLIIFFMGMVFHFYIERFYSAVCVITQSCIQNSASDL